MELLKALFVDDETEYLQTAIKRMKKRGIDVTGVASGPEALTTLAAGEVPVPRRLGIGLAPAHVARKLRGSVGLPERDGLLVRGVADDSPAAEAGLEQGDLVVAAGGEELHRVDDLVRALEAAMEGGTVELTVVRGVDERTVRVPVTAEG